MSFDLKVDATRCAPSMESSAVPTQSSTSPLSERTVVDLPTDPKYRKGWEMLGVQWLQSLDGEHPLARALLPEGWTIQRAPTPYSDHFNATIIDSEGLTQVSMWLKTVSCDQVSGMKTLRESLVSFFHINEELLEQADKKESEVIKDDFKPICYPGYFSEFYCSYGEIVSAIESWGKVEVILMANSGSNHTFIVTFKRPIRFSSYGQGIMVNLTGGHGICHTPFRLRRMYSDGLSSNNVILSHKMMAFDIQSLKTDCFGAMTLWESQGLLPDERLTRIETEVGKHANWTKKEKIINSTFSETDKAKKLLEWIKQSGLSILEKGLHRSGDDPIGQYPIEQIVKNYTTNSSSPWQVLMWDAKKVALTPPLPHT